LIHYYTLLLYLLAISIFDTICDTFIMRVVTSRYLFLLTTLSLSYVNFVLSKNIPVTFIWQFHRGCLIKFTSLLTFKLVTRDDGKAESYLETWNLHYRVFRTLGKNTNNKRHDYIFWDVYYNVIVRSALRRRLY